MGKLDGKVALITGAARGIGAGTARVFASEGARVILGDLRDPLGKEVAESIGEAAQYVHHDVREEESWKNFVAVALEAHGRVDSLVNNAGIMHVSSIVETQVEDLLAVLQTNLVGVFLGMKHAAPAIIQSGGGAIVNISSSQGLEGAPQLGCYVASKFAVTGMTQTAALELGKQGVRINSIHPAGIDTPMGDGSMDEFADVDTDAFFASTPAGRMGRPEEIGSMAAYLASDEARYIHGAQFAVDGGQMAGMSY